jgi:F-type H+-transporting ATPase subunit b
LAALAAGVAFTPYRLVAQESAAAARTEAADSQEAQEKAFLVEGPLVKASAKALHLSVETTAIIYEFINFAILALVIGIPLFRFLPKFLRKRAGKVHTDVESARKVTADANSRLSAVEAKLSSIGEEMLKFKSEVEREMGQDEARIKSALAAESARMVVAAEQEIAMAAAQARRGLRNFAADLAVGQAAKQMDLTPETDRALIAEFVGDVTKGRQN